MNHRIPARLAAAFLLALPFSISCIHVIDAPYKVSETKKEALLFRKGERSHLIIRTGITGLQGAKGLAWVIPVPDVPSKVSEESAKLFPVLYGLIPDKVNAEPLAVRLLPSCSAMSADYSAIRVHEPATTEHFTTQVVEIRQEGAAEVLNEWLESHGFGPVPPANQSYYLKPGRSFLCVRVTKMPPEGSLQIPPLHIEWQKPALEFPLKFSSHSGVFDADLYVLSHRPLSKRQFAHWRFKQVGSRTLDKTTIERLARGFSDAGSILTRFHAQEFNSPGREVTKLDSDPSIESKP
ncbi:MAG: DUF2330 domain-containing protein [Verrucomicrobiaceae bacterium]|nr:DUF2330 domain-containing protein [Verrucomicrobiaceae bacterium]